MSQRQVGYCILVLFLALGFWPAVLFLPAVLALPKCKTPLDTKKP